MKLGISGAHGTGKSTLLSALKKEPFFKDFFFVEEVARRLIKETGSLKDADSNRLVSFQRRVLRRQVEEENKSPRFVSDRTVIDVLSYYEWYILYGKIQKTQTETWSTMIRFIEDRFESSPYDIVFYLPIEFDLEADGVRWTDRESQRTYDSILRGWLNYYSDHYKFFTVSGSLEQRVEQVLNYVLDFCDQKGKGKNGQL
ncbi:MAG: hypothetical protein CV045_02830 [Cyanobacteria bacterium M5B4]|nr:MAG: hypothetical protein CV045_02830 [Cyanobacteria bacterium M5B4]